MDYTEDLFANKNYFKEYAHVKSHLISGKEPEGPVFVSMIIPTYKRAVLFKDALLSAINQEGFIDFEIIIVDNDPERSFKTDTQLLVEAVNHPRIRYYKHDENIGMFPNFNRGIELASGTWITFLHDDDAYFSYYLKRMTDILKQNPEVEGLKGRQYSWIDTGKQSIHELEKNIGFNSGKSRIRKIRKYEHFFENAIGPTGMFYKKSNLLQIGGFPTDYYPSADYLLGSKYLFNFNIYITFEILGVYRWSENESLKFGTQVLMIEQDYFHRKQYGRLIGLKSSTWDSVNTWLIKKRIDQFLLPKDKNIGENLSNIYKQKVKSLTLIKVICRMYRIDVTMRDRSFLKRLRNQFKVQTGN